MKRFPLILFLVFGLILFAARPMLAQEPTVEAAPVSIVTQEAAPPAIVCEDGAVCNVNEAPETPAEPVTPVEPEPWYAKYVAWIAALAIGVGGLVYGALKGANVWLEGRKTDVASMTIAETGYRRAPGPAKSFVLGIIREFVRLGGNLEEILKEVEDDVPYATKPRIPPPANPTAYTSTSSASQDGM